MTLLPAVPLTELAAPPPDAHGLRRRWFTSAHMDLIVWLDEQDSLRAFQLCHGKPLQEQSLIWWAGRGFSLQAVDPGDVEGLGHKGSPLLTASAAPLPAALRPQLAAAGSAVPAALLARIDHLLARYPDPT